MEALKTFVPFDPAKLSALASAFKAELEAQYDAMNAVADVEAFDHAGQVIDDLSVLIAHMEADIEGETLADQRSGYCSERRG